MLQKQEAKIKAHTKRIMGIAYDPESLFIVSISKDGKFKWNDILTCGSLQDEGLGRGGLKSYTVW